MRLKGRAIACTLGDSWPPVEPSATPPLCRTPFAPLPSPTVAWAGGGMHTSRVMRSTGLLVALLSLTAATVSASSGCGGSGHSTGSGTDAGGSDATVKPDVSVDAQDEY